MARESHENLDERLLHRMLFFTDAVFAIVLTLLVLELRPPTGATAAEQAAGVREMAPRLFAFALSFAIVGIFWLAHMSTTRRVARFDWPTAVINLVFLLPICLVPFSSAWLGEGIGMALAWTNYAWVMIAASSANIALVWLTTRDAGRLLASPMSVAERVYRLSRAASPGLAFLIGLVLLATGYVSYARWCWLLIPPLLGASRLAQALTSRKPAPDPA
jgi:uncharacterized membrane protein